MRHKNSGSSAEDPVATALPTPRFAENGYRLPDPLPSGQVLTDSTQRQWLLGKSIGCGGFGEIYCAKELPESHRFDSSKGRDYSVIDADNQMDGNNSYNGLPKRRCVQKFNEKQLKKKNKEKLNKIIKDSNYPFVIKVDHLSGPLFAEMHFYHRVAKPKFIDNWMLTKRLAFIGMPRYVASGIFMSEQTCRRYRFLVLDRLGLDLQKILNKQNNKLSLKSAYTIAMMTLDILAYIHSFGYIHADIKASNLLLGRSETTSPARELYLVDYGLVERYRTQNGEHKQEEEDNRRANSGTIEFTSRDGHVGALTRRSDLEILAYNTISWLSGGRLPWIDCKEHEAVRKQKEYYMSHIDELLRHAFKSKTFVPKGLEEFIRSVSRLGFKEDPDYAAFKLILTRAMVSSGHTNDGLITWGEEPVSKSTKKGSKRPVSSGPDLGRRKGRKNFKQEFEQFELCEIPRKMNRSRAVRSAPTTFSRQRSGSISPNNLLDIELSNPTPQMLEVMQKIRQKQENNVKVLDAIDSNNLNNSLYNRKRIRTFSSSKKGSKTRKLKLNSTSSPLKALNRKLKTSVNYEPIRPQLDTNSNLKSVANNILKKSKKRKNTKKCQIVRKKCSTTHRIPLQKLEINVKTTNMTKRCSNRTVEAKKALKNTRLKKKKTQQKEKKSKILITQRKPKTSVKVLTKKMSKKSVPPSPQRAGIVHKGRTKVSLVVDLPNGSLKCDKKLRTATNGNKRIK